VRRAVIASLLIVAVAATARLALVADEPLKQDDPLLKALEQLQSRPRSLADRRIVSRPEQLDQCVGRFGCPAQRFGDG